MNIVKKHIIIFLLLCAFGNVYGQRLNIEEVEYRRNSIYSLIITHQEQTYWSYVKDVFVDMPLPDKYNNHDLSVKVICIDRKMKKDEKGADFLELNNVASRLVSKWFNRNPFTGICDVELIKQRGLYNASEFDRQIAMRTTRGMALLEDAGEELIHNTFVIVNDIRYEDKEKAGQIAGMVFQILFAVAGGVASGLSGTNVTSTFNDMGDSMNQLMQTLKGFQVNVKTHLYRLEWDEATAAEFYDKMYTEEYDEKKKNYFDTHRSLFKLQYVGSQTSSGKDVSFVGVNLSDPDEMIRKACVRAIDENVANLARNFEPFKIKERITSVNPIQAPVGKKEEITDKTKFEVLEPTLKDGKMTYRRVAVIKPLKGMIWDNRYMAVEEGAAGSTLNATTFTKVSGGQIVKGMLIREIGD